MYIDITPPTPPHARAVRRRGRGEDMGWGDWGDISIHTDINMDNDIHIIINMNIDIILITIPY